uniref:Borealin n=1 Tax=Meloidogyne javanica TaxID=6303 RepID=A0A915M6A3_MELJA
MVRPKNAISPTKEGEIKEKVEAIKKQFAKDIKELEMAKREYSTAFVTAMKAEFAKIIPKEILDMKLVDYIKMMEEEHNVDETYVIEGGPSSSSATFKHPGKYKSINVAGGMHMKPRASKFGELLFSVRGTPVLTTGASMSMLEAKKREAVVQSLLQQEDSMLTPETRKVIGKLKELVNKREEQLPRPTHLHRKKILAKETEKENEE